MRLDIDLHASNCNWPVAGIAQSHSKLESAEVRSTYRAAEISAPTPFKGIDVARQCERLVEAEPASRISLCVPYVHMDVSACYHGIPADGDVREVIALSTMVADLYSLRIIDVGCRGALFARAMTACSRIAHAVQHTAREGYPR